MTIMTITTTAARTCDAKPRKAPRRPSGSGAIGTRSHLRGQPASSGGSRQGEAVQSRLRPPPRPDEKGAFATPSRTKAKAAHGRRGALRRDSLGRFAPWRLDIPPADPAASRAWRGLARAKRVSNFPWLDTAGPDGRGDAAHSTNRPVAAHEVLWSVVRDAVSSRYAKLAYRARK